jgi:hypothetical protein
MAMNAEILRIDGEPDGPPDGKSRSGSERRKRQRRITFRCSDEEHAQVARAADAAGLTVGSHIRECVLQAPQTRRQRRPTVEVQTLARLLGEMNKIGSNIHQILKRVNFGETPLGFEFHEALTGYREVVAGILAALGRTRR